MQSGLILSASSHPPSGGRLAPVGKNQGETLLRNSAGFFILNITNRKNRSLCPGFKV